MTKKIRNLTRKDRKTLGNLIVKLANTTGNKSLVNMSPKESSDEVEKSEEDVTNSVLNYAFDILETILEVLNDDAAIWFADLLGVTIEEYDNLDFDIEMDVIEQLLEAKDFKGFFSKGSQVRNKIKTFVSQYKK
jgi:hypothetical protein